MGGGAFKTSGSVSAPSPAGPPAKGLTPQKKAASPSVAIIYYSTYGHLKALADEIKAGLEAAGVNVDLFQVPETLPAEVLKAM